MKISLPLVRDNWNSYPREELEFYIGEETVTIKLSDTEDREVSIKKSEFILLSRFLAQEAI